MGWICKKCGSENAFNSSICEACLHTGSAAYRWLERKRERAEIKTLHQYREGEVEVTRTTHFFKTIRIVFGLVLGASFVWIAVLMILNGNQYGFQGYQAVERIAKTFPQQIQENCIDVAKPKQEMIRNAMRELEISAQKIKAGTIDIYTGKSNVTSRIRLIAGSISIRRVRFPKSDASLELYRKIIRIEGHLNDSWNRLCGKSGKIVQEGMKLWNSLS